MKYSMIPAHNLMTAFLLALLIGISSTLQAQNNINLDMLIEETQMDSPDDDRMNLIWWIPTEFWMGVQQNDPSSSAEEFEQIIEMFEPYTIVLALDGEISSFGTVKYRSKADIEQNLRIVDSYGDAYRPITDKEDGRDARMMLAIMKPMLENMLGQMGENMEFYLFPGENKKGEPMVAPKEEGYFTVKLDAEEFRFRLPLGSLLPPKFCPLDNEELNGAWNFCPWHGKTLKVSK